MTEPQDSSGPVRCDKFSSIRPQDTFRFDQSPAYVFCEHCNEMVTTDVTYKCGLLTWSVAAMLCLTGCCFGCCLIPFCMKQAKDTIHTCPICYTVMGVHINC